MKHYLTKESEQNGAILSSFYPIPIPSLPTTNQGSASIPFMEGSELTKRLMMNRQTSPGQRKSQSQKKAHPPGDDHQSTDHGQHGQASITNASMSAGQAAASTTAAAAMAQYHQHHSPPVDGSSGMDDMMELEKLNRRRKDFPWKLHCMLEEAETFHNTHIVSWMPDGRSFRVFRPDIFVTHIMPHYFHQTQYRSFQRMLNLYEFTKVLTGPDRGAYSHPSFLRNNRDLCLQMRIRKRTTSSTKKKKPPKASGGTSKKSSETNKAAVARGSHGVVDVQQGGGQQDLPYPPTQHGRGSLDLTSREIMEGLLPIFQQPNSNPLQLHNFFQYSDLQRQQLQMQQSHDQPYEQRSSSEQQHHDDSSLSPLMSRQIHVLQHDLDGWYPSATAAAVAAAPSAPNLTTINVSSTRNFLTSNWDAAAYPRSLMSATPTTEEQRVNRSPMGGMSDLIRSRGHTQYGNSMSDAKSPESKSDNLGHDVKAPGTEQSAVGEGGQQEQEAKQEPPRSSCSLPFHMPLHMDLEPTPLPPSHQKKHDDNK